MAKQFINSEHKMKGITTTDLALTLDRLSAIANDVENETGEVDLAKDIRCAIEYLEKQSSDLIVEKENDCIYKVVQVLVKDDDYDFACPDNEDVWYDHDDIICSTEQDRLEGIIGEEKLQLLNDGKIDYIVCRGDW